LTSVIHDIATGQRISDGSRQNWLKAKQEPLTFERDHLANDLDVIEVTHASGRGTLFPLTVFRQLGVFDEIHLPHYGADYDFSIKARRAGFPVYSCKKCRVFCYLNATGLTTIRNRFSLKSFIRYFTHIRSPGNLQARWWYGWNNCPKYLFLSYIMLDFLRLTGSYFKYFFAEKSGFD